MTEPTSTEGVSCSANTLSGRELLPKICAERECVALADLCTQNPQLQMQTH